MNLEAVAFFEVMDKEPSLLMIWIAALLVGIGGLFLSRLKWWLGVIALVVALVFSLVQIQELNNSLIATAIVREAGSRYVFQSYAASIVAIVLAAIGLFRRWKRSQ